MLSLSRPHLLFVLIVLLACSLAFAGLATSSYWTDELFTLWVVRHSSGFEEVWRRALTDVHPPFYYLFLYAWTHYAGYSEFAVRLPSALFSVAAIGVFALAARRVAGTGGVAFACAAAVLSPFWFYQSQNARSYGLCLLAVSTLLYAALALHARLRERPAGFPWLPVATLAVVGLMGSLTHAYVLLLLGGLLPYLLCTEKNPQARIVMVAIGLVVLACNMAYYRALTQDTRLDLNDLWFENDARFIATQLVKVLKSISGHLVVLAMLALMPVHALWRASPAPADADSADARWATRLCASVLFFTIVSGIGVSLLVAPSFSDRNLLTGAPFMWLLFARGFDLAASRFSARKAGWIGVALLVPGLMLLPGRWLPRNEEWRASAEFVRETPGCADQALPVVFLYRFGPSTPAMHELFERHFYGYYPSGAKRLDAYLPAQFADANTNASALPGRLERRVRRAAGGGCPVLAWGTHDLWDKDVIRLGAELARQAAFISRPVIVRKFDHFKWHVYWWRKTSGASVFLLGTAPATAPCSLPGKEGANGCSEIVIRSLYAYRGRDAAPADAIDGYSVQYRTESGVFDEYPLVVYKTACGRLETWSGQSEQPEEWSICSPPGGSMRAEAVSVRHGR